MQCRPSHSCPYHSPERSLRVCAATKRCRRVTASEYEVFSAYIARYFVGNAATERIALPVSQIVVVDTTEYNESEIAEDTSWKQIQHCLRRQVPSNNRPSTLFAK